jgi:hypothetical protein
MASIPLASLLQVSNFKLHLPLLIRKRRNKMPGPQNLAELNHWPPKLCFFWFLIFPHTLSKSYDETIFVAFEPLT